ERVGTVQGVDASQTQLGDEAILQGLPEAFDAALGLRGASGDEPDAELAQDSPEVGGILGAAEFFLEGPVRVVAHEDIEPIAVEREGQAVVRAELCEQGDIAVQILGGAQVEGEAGARGIVDGAVQGEPGSAVTEPGEGARVERHESAPLGFRGAARADLAPPGGGAWRAAPGRGGGAGPSCG